MRQQVSIRTADGDCPAHVFTPTEGKGPWPGVIFFMDGLAIRPTLFDMGQRLADAGYLVLLPDMFYRLGSYSPLDPKVVFASPSVSETIGPMMSSTSNAKAGAETAAFLAWFDASPDWAGGKIGTTGYCMGGGMSLTAAATYPDRIGAAASFHGGNLATDKPDSPHLIAGRIKARVYLGVADKDSSYPPEMARKLEAALQAGGVDYTSELYAGSLHGWTMADFPIYDPAAAERHWAVLTKLYAETLPG